MMHELIVQWMCQSNSHNVNEGGFVLWSPCSCTREGQSEGSGGDGAGRNLTPVPPTPQ